MKDKGYDDQSLCYMKIGAEDCVLVSLFLQSMMQQFVKYLVEKFLKDAKTNIGGTMFSEWIQKSLDASDKSFCFYITFVAARLLILHSCNIQVLCPLIQYRYISIQSCSTSRTMCSVVSLPAGQTIYVLFTVKLLALQHIHTLVTGSCYVMMYFTQLLLHFL